MIKVSKQYLWAIGLPLFLLAPISSSAQKLELSTDSDSARYYYYKGWEQVLDYGHFTNSEKAYRAMYRHDPELLIGASLLARITPDPKERQQILENLDKKSSRLRGDEKLVLDLFLNLTRLYIYRETNQSDKVASQAPLTIKQGQQTLGYIATKYPDNQYLKSEYIEFLHANEGPQVALDSLAAIFTNPPPFMFGYAAQLKAELKEFDEALIIAKELELKMTEKRAPYVNMVYAKIYKERGDSKLALNHLERALLIDPGHILALRMKKELTNE